MVWVFRHFINERLVYEEQCAGFNDATYLLFKMSCVSSMVIAASNVGRPCEMIWTDDQNLYHRMTISEN